MTELVGKVLNNMDKIPSLPISVSKILEITKNPQVSPKDLNKVISFDPILTGNVLKLVNSAYYSLSTKVTSIVKAIILLGVNTIRNLALTTAIVPIVGAGSKKSWLALDGKGYWKHSIATGATAKLIGNHCGVSKKLQEEYFISGLLHDTGKVILDHALQEKYQKVVEKSTVENINLIDVENDLLKINHVEVGRMLAEKWDLSPELIDVIQFHHNPKECHQETRTLVYAVAIANIYCNQKQIGFSGNRNDISMDPDLLSFLGLKEENFIEWEDIINEEIKKASIFMNIK